MKLTTALLLTFILTSCGDHRIDTKEEGERLMQISREWSKTAAANNVEKTLSYWADDAVIMPPGQPLIKGKKEIREMIEGTSKIPGFKISWRPISVFVSKSGDMAYMIEQNKISVNDSLGNPMIEFNKSVTVWRKESDGSWKNVVDMWNADPSAKTMTVDNK